MICVRSSRGSLPVDLLFGGRYLHLFVQRHGRCLVVLKVVVDVALLFVFVEYHFVVAPYDVLLFFCGELKRGISLNGKFENRNKKNRNTHNRGYDQCGNY